MFPTDAGKAAPNHPRVGFFWASFLGELYLSTCRHVDRLVRKPGGPTPRVVLVRRLGNGRLRGYCRFMGKISRVEPQGYCLAEAMKVPDTLILIRLDPQKR